MSPPGRTLPLRVPVAPGEPMDSWLEALARRNQITVRTLVAALGWQVPNAPGGLVAGVPGEVLRRIEYQAGLPAGRLDDAVLDRYLPTGAVRSRGSRYCPCCLAERDGRWLLAWRLPWTFACTSHRLLLCDACPACGQVPRVHTGPAGLNPPGTCLSSIAPGTCCGAHLRHSIPQRLAPGSKVLAAQRWTGTLIAAATEEGQGAASVPTLGDLGIVASWVLRHAPASRFAGYGAETLAAWHQWHGQRPATRDPPRRSPPASAALTSALAAISMSVLTGDDDRAIGRIRALLPSAGGWRQTRPAGLPARHWKQLSGPARSRFLRALDPGLGPAERLRYRTGTPAASIPADGPALLAARARMIPQLLWPQWAIRLTPAAGLLPGPFRSTLAACLLLPGHPDRATGKAITALHAYRSVLAINAALRTLAEDGHDIVLTALTRLAGYLDEHGSPIDYQRRRDIIPAETSRWRDLCLSASAHPGESRRHRDAQRYLYQLLTGADLHDPRHALAFTSASDRAAYLAFTDTFTTGLRRAAPPRRRPAARARRRRAANLGAAPGLLRWPGPARTRPRRHRPGRHPPARHHRRASHRRGRHAAGHQHRACPARPRTRPPARPAMGPQRPACRLAMATTRPRRPDPRVLRPRICEGGQDAAGTRGLLGHPEIRSRMGDLQKFTVDQKLTAMLFERHAITVCLLCKLG